MCHSPSPGGSRSRVRCVPWFIHKQTQAFCLTTGDRSKRMGVEEDSDNQPGQASLSQAWGQQGKAWGTRRATEEEEDRTLRLGADVWETE